MHQPIEDGLEDYLSGRMDSVRLKAFENHLAACRECHNELGVMVNHAQLLRQLRVSEAVEPAPGFYARVLDRIESQSGNSFWSVLLQPMFAQRLMYASLLLFVLLTSAVFRTPGEEPLAPASNPVTIMAAYDMPEASGADPVHDRQVVLVNLATYGTETASPVTSD